MAMTALGTSAKSLQARRDHWNTLMQLKQLDMAWSDPKTCLATFGGAKKADLKADITTLGNFVGRATSGGTIKPPPPDTDISETGGTTTGGTTSTGGTMGSGGTTGTPTPPPAPTPIPTPAPPPPPSTDPGVPRLTPQTGPPIIEPTKSTFIKGTYHRDPANPNVGSFDSVWKVGDLEIQKTLPLSLNFDASGKMTSCSTLPAVQSFSATCGSVGGGTPGPAPISPPGTAAALCASNPTVTYVKTLSFPASEGCDFGDNGNANEKDGYTTARHETTINLSSIPSTATVCNVQFSMSAQTVSMDDFFFLNFDGVILSTSLGNATRYLPFSDSLYFYDWSKIKGMANKIDGAKPQYCNGEDTGLSTCVMPGNNATSKGPQTITGMLKFDPSIFQKIADYKNPASSHSFQLVTTGDDDDDDCHNSKFSFTVTVSYVP